MLAPAANASIYARPAAPVRTNAIREGPLGLMGAPMRFARNTEIYGEDEPAEYLYQVISGAVRTYRMLDDGRRQISAFYLPGDIFGVEAGEMHLSSAEAISDAQVLVVKRSAVLARAEHEKDLARQLWTLTVRELQRVQEHSLVLIKSAEERVAGFLLEMAGRNSEQRGDRAADVAPGHRRLSRIDDRDGVADLHPARAVRHDRAGDFAAHRVPQSCGAQPAERLKRIGRGQFPAAIRFARGRR